MKVIEEREAKPSEIFEALFEIAREERLSGYDMAEFIQLANNLQLAYQNRVWVGHLQKIQEKPDERRERAKP